MKEIKNKRAFTVTEMITALAIIAVAVVFINTVFVTNWTAYQGQISRTDLWAEANTIIESMTFDGRDAHEIDVASDNVNKTAVLNDRLNQPFVTYRMTSNGEFQMSRPGGGVTILSSHVDFLNSTFLKNGKSLRMNIVLADKVFGRDIKINAASEIYPRN